MSLTPTCWQRPFRTTPRYSQRGKDWRSGVAEAEKGHLMYVRKEGSW